MKYFLALLLLVVAVPAQANHHDDPACADDVKKFCADVKPGKGAIMKCLHQHKDELSAACREKGKHMKEHMKEVHAACKDDVKKLCGDVKVGHGHVMKCLHEHTDKVSAACKEAMTKHHEEKEGTTN